MTGRLIDADALVPIPIGMGDGIWTKWVVTYRDIHDAPTVDAIPISWINDWYDRYNYAEVGDLLNDWASERKEE